MIDIKLVRENPKLVKENIKKRFQDEKVKLVDLILKLDSEWRKLKYSEDSLRSERNKISQKINELKKAKKDAKNEIKSAKAIPGKIEEIQGKRRKLETEINKSLSEIPNIMHKSVPKGKDDTKNKVIKKYGKIPKSKVKNHVEVLENLGLVDFDASAEVSGKGFYYLKGELGLLNQALIRFAIDFMKKKKYEYLEGPLMLNEKSIYAATDKKDIEKSVYKIDDEGLSLIGTSEQSVLAYHAGDVLKELPKKYFSYSMCFRREIGSHGVNEKGLWRTHQFNKVEQFIFCKPEDSDKLYSELRKNTEEIMKALKLPYRIIELCSGDLPNWKTKSEDFDVYRPTTKNYEEVASLSDCSDYQARKLNIRYIDKKTRGIVCTLNNTLIATSRILVAIVENYQQKDGSIKVPSVLQKYTGFKVIKNERRKNG